MINHDIFTEFTIIYILLCRPLSFRLFHHITPPHRAYSTCIRCAHSHPAYASDRTKQMKRQQQQQNYTKETQTNTNKFLCAQTNGNSFYDEREKATNV